MYDDSTTDVPLFIPDDLQDAYQSEAAAQVSQTHATRHSAPVTPVAAPRVPRSHRNASTDRTLVVVGIVLALAGAAACTAWWAWLANETGSALWNNFAVGGGAAVVLGVITATGVWLTRRAPAAEKAQPPVIR